MSFPIDPESPKIELNWKSYKPNTEGQSKQEQAQGNSSKKRTKSMKIYDDRDHKA